MCELMEQVASPALAIGGCTIFHGNIRSGVSNLKRKACASPGITVQCLTIPITVSMYVCHIVSWDALHGPGHYRV